MGASAAASGFDDSIARLRDPFLQNQKGFYRSIVGHRLKTFRGRTDHYALLPAVTWYDAVALEKQCGYRIRWPSGSPYIEVVTKIDDLGQDKLHFGRGAHGLVTLGYGKKSGYVALKVSKEGAAAFADADLPITRASENVVCVEDEWQEGGCNYQVMQLAGLGNCAQMVERVLPVADEDLREQFCFLIVKGLLDGLDALHREGIAHLDVKLSNLVLEKDGSPKFIDFGTSKKVGRDGIVKGESEGDFDYMSPERLAVDLFRDEGESKSKYVRDCGAKGFNGFKADLWSVGKVLFELHAQYDPILTSGAMYDQLSKLSVDKDAVRRFIDAEKEPFGEPHPDTLMSLAFQFLEFDPERRPSIAEARDSKWYRKLAGDVAHGRGRVEKLFVTLAQEVIPGDHRFIPTDDNYQRRSVTRARPLAVAPSRLSKLCSCRKLPPLSAPQVARIDRDGLEVQLIQLIRTGQSQITVGGAPGIGKSYLVNCVMHKFAKSGRVILWLRSEDRKPFKGSNPFGGFEHLWSDLKREWGCSDIGTFFRQEKLKPIVVFEDHDPSLKPGKGDFLLDAQLVIVTRKNCKVDLLVERVDDHDIDRWMRGLLVKHPQGEIKNLCRFFGNSPGPLVRAAAYLSNSERSISRYLDRLDLDQNLSRDFTNLVGFQVGPPLKEYYAQMVQWIRPTELWSSLGILRWIGTGSLSASLLEGLGPIPKLRELRELGLICRAFAGGNHVMPQPLRDVFQRPNDLHVVESLVEALMRATPGNTIPPGQDYLVGPMQQLLDAPFRGKVRPLFRTLLSHFLKSGDRFELRRLFKKASSHGVSISKAPWRERCEIHRSLADAALQFGSVWQFEEHMKQALAAFEAGKQEESPVRLAMDLVGLAERRDGFPMRLCLPLGRVCESSGDLRKSLLYYSRSARETRSREAILGAARLSHKLGAYGDAVGYYQQLLPLEEDPVGYYQQLVCLKEESTCRDFREALLHWRGIGKSHVRYRLIDACRDAELEELVWELQLDQLEYVQKMGQNVRTQKMAVALLELGMIALQPHIARRDMFEYFLGRSLAIYPKIGMSRPRWSPPSLRVEESGSLSDSSDTTIVTEPSGGALGKGHRILAEAYLLIGLDFRCTVLDCSHSSDLDMSRCDYWRAHMSEVLLYDKRLKTYMGWSLCRSEIAIPALERLASAYSALDMKEEGIATLRTTLDLSLERVSEHHVRIRPALEKLSSLDFSGEVLGYFKKTFAEFGRPQNQTLRKIDAEERGIFGLLLVWVREARLTESEWGDVGKMLRKAQRSHPSLDYTAGFLSVSYVISGPAKLDYLLLALRSASSLLLRLSYVEMICGQLDPSERLKPLLETHKLADQLEVGLEERYQLGSAALDHVLEHGGGSSREMHSFLRRQKRFLDAYVGMDDSPALQCQSGGHLSNDYLKLALLWHDQGETLQFIRLCDQALKWANKGAENGEISPEMDLLRGLSSRRVFSHCIDLSLATMSVEGVEAERLQLAYGCPGAAEDPRYPLIPALLQGCASSDESSSLPTDSFPSESEESEDAIDALPVRAARRPVRGDGSVRGTSGVGNSDSDSDRGAAAAGRPAVPYSDSEDGSPPVRAARRPVRGDGPVRGTSGLGSSDSDSDNGAAAAGRPAVPYPDLDEDSPPPVRAAHRPVGGKRRWVKSDSDSASD